jgi:hypothetical protein
MNGARTWMILSLLCALFTCANLSGPGGEGNGSETVARGIILDSAGVPAAGIPVQLLPSGHNPAAFDTIPAAWRVFTNNKGEYHLVNISAGSYDIEASSISTGLKALVTGIEITGKKVETAVQTVSLEKTGTVFVELAGLAPRNGDYIYLPGTSTFSTITDRDRITGKAVLHGVPAGSFAKLIYVAVAEARNTDLLSDTLTISPGDTVASAYAAWKYSRRLVLNTTVSGADVSEDVVNFPVLVRLNAVNFDFSEAQTGGNDIRFAKCDGSPLAFEIERWDAAGRQAEIWVKVDTVNGNNSYQSILLYWGNASASSQSDGGAVFDTAGGFQSVWHLGDNADTVRDVTPNRCHGVGYGNLSRSSCMIGFGRTFGGSKTYCDMGNVFNPDRKNFTVSAWVKRGSATGIRAIIAKSEGGAPSSGYGWNLSIGANAQLQCFMANGGSNWGDAGAFNFWSSTDAEITDTTAWHHVVAVVDRSNNRNCRTYIDGIDVSDSYGGDVTAVGSLTNAFPLRIGTESDGDCQWIGSIDECVISRTVRPAAWIRLCYSNQGPIDRLVRFR